VLWEGEPVPGSRQQGKAEPGALCAGGAAAVGQQGRAAPAGCRRLVPRPARGGTSGPALARPSFSGLVK